MSACFHGICNTKLDFFLIPYSDGYSSYCYIYERRNIKILNPRLRFYKFVKSTSGQKCILFFLIFVFSLSKKSLKLISISKLKCMNSCRKWVVLRILSG